MNHHLPSPRLRLGLTTETDQEPTVWFLTNLPHSSPPPRTAGIHAGLIRTGPVLLPLFFLRLAWDTEPLLLETSLNPYEPDFHGLTLLRRLTTQDTYWLQYQNAETAHTLTITNTHQPFYRDAVQLLEAHTPWTATEFQLAQAAIVQAWPTPETRYQYISSPPTPINGHPLA